jgi:hypothetical protein
MFDSKWLEVVSQFVNVARIAVEKPGVEGTICFIVLMSGLVVERALKYYFDSRKVSRKKKRSKSLAITIVLSL